MSRWDWIRFLEDPDLTPAQKQVWVVLRQADVKFGRVFYSMPTLAQKCGLTVRTVQRACRVLEAKGWLHITRRQHPAGDPTSHLFRPLIGFHQASPAVSNEAVEASDESPPTPTADHHPATYPQPKPPTDSTLSEDLGASDPGILASQNDKQPDPALPARHTWLEWGISAPHKVVNWVQEHEIIPSVRVRHWIHQYGMAKTAQVISWALSAPDQAIRSVTAWIEAALAQGWNGHNRWIQDWEASRRAKMDAERTVQLVQQERVQSDQVKAHQERDQKEWYAIRESLTPEAFEDLAQAVYAHLEARHQWTPALTRRLAHPDSVTFRYAALDLIRSGQWAAHGRSDRAS